MCLRRCACAVLDVAVVRALRDRCSYAVVLIHLVMLAAVFDVVAAMQCSSRCVVDLSGSRAPCMPLRADGALPCPVAGDGRGVGVGAVVTQWSGCLPPGALPSLAGCLASRGWGCFFWWA